MVKDTLFTLVGDFMNGLSGPFYCPECATLQGLLGYFPHLGEHLEVITVPYERPRAEIVAVLGEAHQECPCLVLGDPARAAGLSVGTTEQGKSFLDDHRAIIEYLARNYGTSRPGHD